MNRSVLLQRLTTRILGYIVLTDKSLSNKCRRHVFITTNAQFNYVILRFRRAAPPRVSNVMDGEKLKEMNKTLESVDMDSGK